MRLTMFKELKQGIVFTVVTMLLFGGGYHVALDETLGAPTPAVGR
jgi:hypothetical protein